MKPADLVALVDSIDLSWFPARVHLRATALGRDRVEVRCYMRIRSFTDGKRRYLETNQSTTVRKFTRRSALAWIRRLVRHHLLHELDECLRVASYERPFDPHQGKLRIVHQGLASVDERHA